MQRTKIYSLCNMVYILIAKRVRNFCTKIKPTKLTL